MSITAFSKKILIFLLAIILILNIANAISIYLKLTYHLSNNRSVVRLFHFDQEQNIPTLFSFLILLISTLLLFYIRTSLKNIHHKNKIWFILAFIFLFLSIDEAISIHEIIGHFLTKKNQFKGILYFSWVIPYGIAGIILLFSLINFIKNLPKRIAILFILSGIIFIGGAIGFELLGASLASVNSNHEFSTIYNLYTTLEETLEMLGISLFIYSLLEYIKIMKLMPLLIKFYR